MKRIVQHRQGHSRTKGENIVNSWLKVRLDLSSPGLFSLIWFCQSKGKLKSLQDLAHTFKYKILKIGFFYLGFTNLLKITALLPVDGTHGFGQAELVWAKIVLNETLQISLTQGDPHSMFAVLLYQFEVALCQKRQRQQRQCSQKHSLK